MKRSLLLAAGLFGAILAFPQTPHSLLWRISGRGITKPSYLFGTMHILCADQAVLSDSLKAAIDAVDEVYFEFNLTDTADMLSAALSMRMTGGQSLSDLLKPDDYNRIKNYFSAHQSMLPFWALEHLKPMLISSLIEEQSLGCSSMDGMELRIMKDMREKDPQKPVRGLETAAFQAGLFDSIPYKKQAKELVDYIDSVEENKKITKQLADLYVRQDLDGIQALSNKDDPGMDEYMDLLLYGRNRKWVKELVTLLPQKSLLVAVGAAHLPGPEGVIQLLKKEGFTVEPVPGR